MKVLDGIRGSPERIRLQTQSFWTFRLLARDGHFRRAFRGLASWHQQRVTIRAAKDWTLSRAT